MTDRAFVERWGRDSEAYRRYRETARGLLATDDRFRAAREEWADFFATSHGEALDGFDAEDAARDRDAGDVTGGDADPADPADDLFVDALYYDFVVDRLVGAAEREFEFALANREPRANTDALSFEFRALHRRVAEAGGVPDGSGFAADEVAAADLRAADAELLRALYESVVPREFRRTLGEYYTPRGVAELAVEALDADWGTATFLDPGCGSGVFLAVCVDRKLAALRGTRSPAAVVEAVTDTVLGVDLNPVAVTSAKLAYLLALAPVLDDADVEAVELPVFLTDALGLTRDDDLSLAGEPVAPTADYLVGNPPWIPWSRLADDLKARWRETYADELDLLPHDGAAARLGHANDDVSLPYVWVCIHRYLTEGGSASFVLKRDATKGPAGRLLRTLTVGDRPLALDHVHDFGRLRPFGEQVSADAAIYTFRADADPDGSFPADATAWTAPTADGSSDPGRTPEFATADAMRETLSRERTALVPVDPDDRTSAWVREDAERAALGECVHEIRHGVKDDAEDVFGLDRDRLADLEPDLVYPYLKSRHVVKYGLFGHDLRLVPVRKANEDNEDELRDRYPATYDYLRSHRDALDARSSSWLRQGPFYNVFGVGEYTWSDYKVVWCRLGFKPHFAVVSTVEDTDLGEKPVVPGDHCMFVATDSRREAHFLCGLLNSAPYQRSLETVASEGKASLSKAVVSRLELPAYRATDRHRRLADLSMAAHEVVPEHTDASKRAYNRKTIPELDEIQAEIDRIAEASLTDEPAGG